MAGLGSVWPRACGRWLPVRLPGFSLAALMFESRGAHFLFVVSLHHARTHEPLLSITGPKITIRPDSTQGRQAPVPLDRLPPAPAGSADDAPGTARRAVAAMVRELNDLLAPMISQLEALRQAGSTSDSLRRSREPARRRIIGDLHAWRSCPGLYRRTALSGLPGFCSGLPAVTVCGVRAGWWRRRRGGRGSGR